MTFSPAELERADAAEKDADDARAAAQAHAEAILDDCFEAYHTLARSTPRMALRIALCAALELPLDELVAACHAPGSYEYRMHYMIEAFAQRFGDALADGVLSTVT